MSTRYEYARSGRDRSLLLIFTEGAFEGLPFEVRLAAPWTGHGYGELSQLKPVDRMQFHQHGYVVLREITAAASGAETAAPELEMAQIDDLLRHAA